MRIGLLSDIHVDINNKEGNNVEDAILKTLDDKNVDIFIIAGDVSSNYQETLRVLTDFRRGLGQKYSLFQVIMIYGISHIKVWIRGQFMKHLVNLVVL